jgi:hypothetical protein
MANIRTQLVSGQRRIITKIINNQRRVSCSCCEACCPYDANQLGIGYNEIDLPDVISFATDFRAEEEQDRTYNPLIVNATRNGSTYITEPYTLTIERDPENITLTFISRIVRGFDDFSGTFVWGVEQDEDVPVSNSGPCLLRTFDGSIELGDVQWRDKFLDAYAVTTALGGFPVFRESLCSWSGFDPNYGPTGSNVTLLLNPASAGRPRNALWTFAGFPRQDAGPYNSPLGTYSSSTYTWTVAA